MADQTLVRTTQALAVTSSLVMAGVYFGTSQLGITPILPLPTPEVARIFSELYHGGAPLMIALGVGSAALYGTSAYLVPETRTEYSVAAASTIGTLAYTGIAMMSGIQKLLQVAELGEKSAVPRDQVIAMVMAWRAQNFVRAGLAFAGGVFGIYGITKRL